MHRRRVTDEDFRALAAVVRQYAKDHGEDVIGALMRTGAFHVLSEERLIELAKEVETAPAPGVPQEDGHRDRA